METYISKYAFHTTQTLSHIHGHRLLLEKLMKNLTISSRNYAQSYISYKDICIILQTGI